MTGILIDDEQGGFRAGSGCVDHIFKGREVRRNEKKCMYIGLINLEVYNSVNSKAL